MIDCGVEKDHPLGAQWCNTTKSEKISRRICYLQAPSQYTAFQRVTSFRNDIERIAIESHQTVRNWSLRASGRQETNSSQTTVQEGHPPHSDPPQSFPSLIGVCCHLDTAHNRRHPPRLGSLYDSLVPARARFQQHRPNGH